MLKKTLRKIKIAIESFDIDDDKPHRVVFTTQNDNRVDDSVCVPLAGIAFEIDDPLRPLIPQETHPNCRCYYVDEITGQVVTNISSRRSTRKRNELTDIQRKELNREQKQYLTRKKEKLIIKQIEKYEEYQEREEKLETFVEKVFPKNLEQIGKWISSI
jgi:hypothetical protein